MLEFVDIPVSRGSSKVSAHLTIIFMSCHAAAVYLDSMEWTVESGLLTPTHKLRRHALQKHYAAQVENMYANLSA